MTKTDGYVALPHYQEKDPVIVRPMTLAEGLALDHGPLLFVSLKGDVRNCRRNGKVRTWKRDATRVEIPVKYGLRECGTFSWSPAAQRFTCDSQNVYLVVRKPSELHLN